MRTIVLGMGNPILSDDSIGVRLAREAALGLLGSPEVDVLEECSAGGLLLLDVLAGYDRAIVLDSVKTRGGTPGAWYRFDARALRETRNLRNVHDVNFATALELGRRLGVQLPADEEIHVLAVEVADDATFGDALSPALGAAYEETRSGILDEIRSILAG